MEDLKSDAAQTICQELNQLIVNLKSKDLIISSWFGMFDLSQNPYEKINRGYEYQPLAGAADDKNFPWFLYWEIAWVVLNNRFLPGQRVLDLGGTSSLFSYYLASKGLDVTTIDLQENLVENANRVGKQTGWKLKNYVMDMCDIRFEEQFDHITSICVYEHIPMYSRVEINRRIKDLLVDDGKFSITFDYCNPSRFAQINSIENIYKQFVEPSGLALRGNPEFVDNGKRYLLHPFFSPKVSLGFKRRCIQLKEFGWSQFLTTKRANDYTFGALFMEKRGQSV